MRIVSCTYARHAEQILYIFNEAIENSTALYDYTPRPLASMVDWFADKEARQLPVLGFENDAGVLLGFASYGAFRVRPAFKYAIEHSIYIHPDYRGQGLGKKLLLLIIEKAQEQGYHTLIGGIDAENTASIALHQQLGFSHAGTIKQSGFKFGRWLDLAFYQLILPTPENPVDG
ncbi:GNAT family N-acetyltransferase [Iodobacter fluviatilis]|uniref:N-acyltransferase YncA n=1 Tax=Iodobacter fluviatilis TaxID=537 RepID=A0A377QAB0_9NEIS|nr:GNAT family N-acetyltransferase [Iodobacter fluviatilis]TCU83725.1 phosphinothricin acetyltransferase [Iodobacter fluviatilis]STQ91767.1 N-acyltransferase YncA [Iodobacter fluviatilis]